MAVPLKVSLRIEEWLMKVPFRITGHLWTANKVVVVDLNDGEHSGRGEGMPVYYLGESLEGLCDSISGVVGAIERGIDREDLQRLMPPGGARNAVDCALWDLEAKRAQQSIWALTGIDPQPVITAFTLGIEDTPAAMADRAREAANYSLLKIKVDADQPVERVAAIRGARPDADLMVDANQAWTFDQLREFSPRLAELGVTVIEQPLPRGEDAALEGYQSPIPLCADESCQHRGELDQLKGRYQIVNVKLDKAGGLTEGLLLAQAALQHGFQLWVGNMGGTSLAMAPGFVLAQLCDFVELDGPLLLKEDRVPALRCEGGKIFGFEAALWG